MLYILHHLWYTKVVVKKQITKGDKTMKLSKIKVKDAKSIAESLIDKGEVELVNGLKVQVMSINEKECIRRGWNKAQIGRIESGFYNGVYFFNDGTELENSLERYAIYSVAQIARVLLNAQR